MRKRYANSYREGMVLIAVLWIVAVLTVIVAVLGRKSMLDSKVCLARMEATRCKWACRAGIEKAIAILNEDERETDCLMDLWNENPTDFNDVALERCRFTVQVIDETSKLNINTATREQLLGLPYMTEDVADAIIDWRDTDETPGEVGVEGGYYENLPYGYLTRNGPFRTIRELLLVRGVTEELFYGEDTNLNGRLDYNEMDGNATPPNDNGDNVLDQGWAAYLTCYPTGGSGTGTGQTTQSTGQTTQSTGQTTQSTGQTSQNTGQTSQGTGQTNQSTGQTSQNTGQTSQGTRQTNQSTGQTNQNTGQTNQGTGQTNQGTGQTNQGTGQTNQGTGQTTTGTTQAGTQTTGQINVNTASDFVLAALLGGGDEALNTAQAIIRYRDTLMYGIETPSELVDAGVISSEDFQLIQNYITVTSNIFTIRCIATAERNGPYGATLQTEAVIDRSTSPYKILYWYQGASN
jgi:type II secretory pathway component PulK